MAWAGCELVLKCAGVGVVVAGCGFIVRGSTGLVVGCPVWAPGGVAADVSP